MASNVVSNEHMHLSPRECCLRPQSQPWGTGPRPLLSGCVVMALRQTSLSGYRIHKTCWLFLLFLTVMSATQDNDVWGSSDLCALIMQSRSQEQSGCTSARDTFHLAGCSPLQSLIPLFLHQLWFALDPVFRLVTIGVATGVGCERIHRVESTESKAFIYFSRRKGAGVKRYTSREMEGLFYSVIKGRELQLGGHDN